MSRSLFAAAATSFSKGTACSLLPLLLLLLLLLPLLLPLLLLLALLLLLKMLALTCWAWAMTSSKSSAGAPLAFLGFPGIAATASCREGKTRR
jgi:hypothetical protein